MTEAPSSSTSSHSLTRPYEEETADLHGYWRALVRRRWLVLPFVIATIAVTGIVTLRQTRVFDATCTIIIDLAAPKILEKEAFQEVVETGTGGYWYSKEYYETQYKVIGSRSVAQRVVDRLQLGSNLKYLGLDPGLDPVALEAAKKRRDPIQVLLKNLKIEPVKDSRVVRLRYEDPDPALAASIANALAEAYIAESLSVRATTTQGASEWLEQQRADLETKMDQTGKELFDFKRSHDIVATTWEDRQAMVTQRLTQVNDALTRARVRRAELQARNEAIQALGKAPGLDGQSLDSLLPISATSAVQQMKVRYQEVQAECAELEAKYLPDHPRLDSCAKRRASARQSLQDEMRSVLEAVKNEYKDAVKTERNLLTLLEETKADALAVNQYEREYLELKRSYDNNQRLYELVLKRLKDTGVSGMLQASNVRILDRARPATVPVRPSLAGNMALAVILGLVGGIGLAFLAEMLDRSIKNQFQIEDALGLVFLGIVPSIERNKDGTSQDLVVHTQPKSAVAECLRAVRTNLLFMSPEKQLKTIMVTSSGPQEGKTTTAISLAIAMTTSGQRVLLVDADMRRPRIHRVFGQRNLAGLSNLILGEGKLEDLALPTPIPGLSFLSCGPVPPNPAELLHTEAFRRILEQMSASFDRIIIDSPPVGVVADAVVMSTHVDGTVIVLKAGRTYREVAKLTVRQLRDVNANIFGAVLNDLNLEDQKYGQYSYYYRYGYYYGESREGPAPHA
ncbi:MAG: polysaccharide biosynthesis tyrosine autokinase [Anaeromyxobacter sp.]|nr:polysaccharide biosynthesis tyrosine autokinase [Anaeromyxobacter sp.]